VKIGDLIVVSDIRFTTNINASICKVNPIVIENY